MRIVCSLALAVLAALGTGCGRTAAAPPPPAPRPVNVARAEARDVPLYFDEIGNTTAVETVNVQAQVAGQITEIHFADGADIKQGDLLFSIDPRPYEASLAKARATLAQDQAKAQFQRIQVRRAEDLRDKKVNSTQDLDQARSTLLELEAVVKSDEASVRTAELNLEYCQIRAPIEGRLGKRLVDRGNITSSPGGAVLVSITRQNPIYADFTVAEDKLSMVREYLGRGALTVEAAFGGDRTKKRAGQFMFFDNAISAGNGTVRLRAVLPNDDRMFWPGQFVNVRLVLDTLKGAVIVPLAAMQTGQIGNFVFIVKPDNVVDIRRVKPGQRQGEGIVISEGLKAGENVVVTGQLFLAPGAKVNVANAEELKKQDQGAAVAEDKPAEDKKAM